MYNNYRLNNNTMIDKRHLLKVTFWWTSIVYVVCFVGVSVFSGLRPFFLQNALHMSAVESQSITTAGTFISGLIIWNIVTLLAAWLFAALFNSIKK